MQSRLAGIKGLIDNKANQFLSDFSFIFKLCITRCPQTKGKVNRQIKILDEIHTYEGKLPIK